MSSIDRQPAVTFTWQCAHSASGEAREVSRHVVACETCGAALVVSRRNPPPKKDAR